MKKLFTCMIASLLVLTLLSPGAVQASNSEVIETSDVAQIWSVLRDEEKLVLNSEGMLVVLANDYTNNPAYERFLAVVEHCNVSIAENVIEVASLNDVKIVAYENIDQTQLQDITYTTSFETVPGELQFPDTEASVCGGKDDLFNPIIRDDGAPHSCSAQPIELLDICETNYQYLVSYYESMLVLQQSYPTFDAHMATITLWVGRVKPNGIWDYKVSSAYGPYNNVLCAYYNGTYHHITAEYFGNLHYGYTGSYLFTLNMLHTGSSAVSGFDPADVDDWPAIDEGFHLKRG